MITGSNFKEVGVKVVVLHHQFVVFLQRQRVYRTLKVDLTLNKKKVKKEESGKKNKEGVISDREMPCKINKNVVLGK